MGFYIYLEYYFDTRETLIKIYWKVDISVLVLRLGLKYFFKQL